jgi:hypothetical protein
VKKKYQRSIIRNRSDNQHPFKIQTDQSQQGKIASTDTITISARSQSTELMKNNPRNPEDSSRNSMQMWGGARN